MHYEHVFRPELIPKLIGYDDYMAVWNEIVKEGLKHKSIPNHKIMITNGLHPFW